MCFVCTVSDGCSDLDLCVCWILTFRTAAHEANLSLSPHIPQSVADVLVYKNLHLLNIPSS